MRLLPLLFLLIGTGQPVRADFDYWRFLGNKCDELLRGVKSGVSKPAAKKVQSQAGLGKDGYGYQFQDTFELPLELEASLRKHAKAKLKAKKGVEHGTFVVRTREQYEELPADIHNFIKKSNKHVISHFEDQQLSYIGIMIDVTANGEWHGDSGQIDLNFLMNFGGPSPKVGKVKMTKHSETFLEPENRDFPTESVNLGQSVLLNSIRRAAREDGAFPGYHKGPPLKDTMIFSSKAPVEYRTGLMVVYARRETPKTPDSIPTEF